MFLNQHSWHAAYEVAALLMKITALQETEHAIWFNSYQNGREQGIVVRCMSLPYERDAFYVAQGRYDDSEAGLLNVWWGSETNSGISDSAWRNMIACRVTANQAAELITEMIEKSIGG